jgi:hypothetical protein
VLIVSCALAGSTDSSPMYLFEKNHMEAEAPSAPVAKQPSPSVSYGVKLVYPMHAVAGRNKQEMPARIRLQLSAVSVRALRKLALPLLARSQLCGLLPVNYCILWSTDVTREPAPPQHPDGRSSSAACELVVT